MSFGTSYDIKFQPAAGMELNNTENWNVNNWITGNQNDGFKYDGCSAFQKILDGKSYRVRALNSKTIAIISSAIQPWGVQYLKRCAKKGDQRQWFEPLWKRRVKHFERLIPRNLHGAFKADGGCKFKNGFE